MKHLVLEQDLHNENNFLNNEEKLRVEGNDFIFRPEIDTA